LLPTHIPWKDLGRIEHLSGDAARETGQVGPVHPYVRGDSKVIGSVKLYEKHCIALQQACAHHVPDAKKVSVALSFSGRMIHPEIAASYQIWVYQPRRSGLR
jgi:hypothetical protein